MTIISESVLIESKSARDGQLANTTHEKAEDVLSKAKALLYFAMHQGNKVAITEQVSEFYEAPVDTIRSVYSRHKDEFASDGVHELKGKTLKALIAIGHGTMQLPDSTTRLVTWNPRGTLRLGMLLRDSAVAKAIRTELLNVVEESGKKSERIQELELQLAIAQANATTTTNQVRLVEKTESLANLHGVPMALVLLGRSNDVAEVEKPTIEVIDDKHKVTFKGQTLKQVAEYVQKRYGVRLKNGGSVAKILKSAEKDSLIAHIPRSVVQEYIPQEHLQEVYRLVTEGNRQMLLGE